MNIIKIHNKIKQAIFRIAIGNLILLDNYL